MLRSVAALLLPDLAPFEFATIREVFGIDRTADGVPPIALRLCGPSRGSASR